jgi:hypothetical protein
MDHAGEFRQYAIAGGLDDPAVMLADLWFDHLAQMRCDSFVRGFLVDTHQARIAHHIGREDRGEATGGGRSGHSSKSENFRAEFNLSRRGKPHFH